MKLILLGAPGSGKGTVARELENKLGTPVLTTSSILRDETKSGSAAGKTMKEFMDVGRLVPDELVIQAVMTKLSKFDGYILDGFPRTLKQAEVFEAELGQAGVKIDKVIYLDLPSGSCKTTQFAEVDL